MAGLSGRWVSLSYTSLTQGSSKPKEHFTFPRKSNGHPLQLGKHWWFPVRKSIQLAVICILHWFQFLSALRAQFLMQWVEHDIA